MLDIVTFVMAHVAVLVGDNGIESLQQTKKLKETICKEAVSGREPYVPVRPLQDVHQRGYSYSWSF